MLKSYEFSDSIDVLNSDINESPTSNFLKAKNNILENWDMIDNPEQLWSLLKDPMCSQGASEVVFISIPPQIMQLEATPKLYHNDLKLHGKLSIHDINSYALEKFLQCTEGAPFAQISAMPIDSNIYLKLFRDTFSINSKFKEKQTIQLSKFYEPNGFVSYAVFDTFEDSLGLNNLTINYLHKLLGFANEKLVQICKDKNMPRQTLSPREKNVLLNLVQGKSNSQIASELKISIHTINSYIRSLGLKLEAKDKITIALKALSLNIL